MIAKAMGWATKSLSCEVWRGTSQGRWKASLGWAMLLVTLRVQGFDPACQQQSDVSVCVWCYLLVMRGEVIWRVARGKASYVTCSMHWIQWYVIVWVLSGTCLHLAVSVGNSSNKVRNRHYCWDCRSNISHHQLSWATVCTVDIININGHYCHTYCY